MRIARALVLLVVLALSVGAMAEGASAASPPPLSAQRATALRPVVVALAASDAKDTPATVSAVRRACQALSPGDVVLSSYRAFCLTTLDVRKAQNTFIAAAKRCRTLRCYTAGAARLARRTAPLRGQVRSTNRIFRREVGPPACQALFVIDDQQVHLVDRAVSTLAALGAARTAAAATSRYRAVAKVLKALTAPDPQDGKQVEIFDTSCAPASAG